jgi:hypothetical protein
MVALLSAFLAELSRPNNMDTEPLLAETWVKRRSLGIYILAKNNLITSLLNYS